MRTLAFALSLTTLPGIAAAQTFVVDADNGPGTNFLGIAEAVAAVPEGAVLLVRPGLYAPFAITDKSLKILAEPGAVVTNGIAGPIVVAVDGLSAGKSVVLSGLSVQPNHVTSSVRVHFSQCAGSVLLDRVGIGLQTTAVLEAHACDRLLIRDLGNTSFLRCEFTNCNTVAERSAMGAGPVVSGLVPGSGIVATGGTLQLVDCTVRAVVALPPFQAHAVEMQGGDLRVLGNTTLTGGFGSPAFAIGGTGTARVAPTATLSAPAFAPGVAATTLAMPTVTTTFAAAQATVNTTGEAGQLAAVAIALPGPLLTLPGLDAIWLDGASMTFVGVGVLGASPLVVQLPWTGGALPGTRALFQAVTFDPIAGMAISNPSLLLLP